MTSTVILSGGLDSTVALAVAIERYGLPARGVTFDYGQRHRREIDSARRVADHYGIDLGVVDLRGLLSGSALLGDGPVPEGHYAAPTMADTVVHGRNMLFASVALSLAGPGGRLVTGVHAGDHHVYPDCRPEFWEAFSGAARAYDVEVVTPFVHITKAQIAAIGHDLDAPMGLTWSCYNGGAVHCGRCGTCVERAEAFALAAVPDPTDYVDPEFWRARTC